VKELLVDRARALGAWTKAQTDRTERAGRIRPLLEEKVLQEAFDRGLRSR
jgi:hypothetical protein